MKTYVKLPLLIALSALIFTFSSCTKEETSNPAYQQSSLTSDDAFQAGKIIAASTCIIGTWELRQAQIGIITTEYSSGNGNFFKFSHSAYEKYRNGSLIKRGHYTIIKDASVEAEVGLVIPTGQFTNRIIFDDDFVSPKTFIQVLNNRLSFLSGYFPLDEGSDLLYKRIENNR